MKKLLTIIAVLTVFAANSQSFGIKGDLGFGWAGIPKDVWISGDSRFTYSGGVFSDIKIYKGLNFSPELLFTHATINYEWASDSYTDQSGNAGTQALSWSKIGYNYIELPLQIKLKDKRVYAVTGIAPMYTLTGTKEYHSLRPLPGSTTTMKGSQDYSGFNLMYIIGAGFRVNEKFSIDFKYNTTISPIDDIGYRLNRFTAGISYAIRN